MTTGKTLSPNNAINTDSKKGRAFVAPLFTAAYGERSPLASLGDNAELNRERLPLLRSGRSRRSRLRPLWGTV